MAGGHVGQAGGRERMAGQGRVRWARNQAPHRTGRNMGKTHRHPHHAPSMCRYSLRSSSGPGAVPSL